MTEDPGFRSNVVSLDRVRESARRSVAESAPVDDLPARPRTRGDCASVPRPCPFVSCKFNLFLDVGNQGRGPGLILSGVEPWEMPSELSCALDIVDSTPDGATTETIAEAWGQTRQNVSRIEQDVLKRPHVRAWAENWRGQRSRPAHDPYEQADGEHGEGYFLAEEDEDPLTARVWNTYERESRERAGGHAVLRGADGRVVRPRHWRKEDRKPMDPKPVREDAERLILQMATARGAAGSSVQQAADAARLPSKGAAYVLLVKLEGRGLLARARGRNRYRIKSSIGDTRGVSASADTERRASKVRRIARELDELAGGFAESTACAIREFVDFLRRAA